MTVPSPAGLAPRALAAPLAGAGDVGNRLAQGWRGPAFAAAVACAGALPGLLAVPPLDRDESRTAQAAAQMLETGDLVNVRVQDEPWRGKPPGLPWLQAAAMRALSTPEARDIRVHRLPSLLGAMLAAAACAWGAGGFLPASRAALAGMLLGGGLLLSTEGFVARTDAVLCGAVTLALAALGRLYAQARLAAPAPSGTRGALWAGLSLSVVTDGTAAPMAVAATLLTLAVADRDARWMRRIGWGWGVALLLLVVGPWAAAAAVSDDGAAWWGVPAATAPFEIGDRAGITAVPGLNALLTPALFFPGVLLLPAVALAAWTRRGEPGVRFALAWLIPGGLVLEVLSPARPQALLPLYGALAWLGAFALVEAGRARWARGLGAGLAVLTAVGLAAGVLLVSRLYDGPAATAALVAALLLAAASAGAALLVLRRPAWAALVATAATLAAHGVASAAWLPRLDALWVSQRAARLVARAGLDPRNGVTPGPVAVVGYAEPSLVFALGTGVERDDPDDAAISAAAGQPVLVEGRQDAAFRAALARDGAAADPAGSVSGFDYAAGRPVTLTLWRSRS